MTTTLFFKKYNIIQGFKIKNIEYLKDTYCSAFGPQTSDIILKEKGKNIQQKMYFIILCFLNGIEYEYYTKSKILRNEK